MEIPIEVLHRIFKEGLLKKDLYSCSLVKRTWSLVALKILWSKPMKPADTIHTLISCLSQQAKDDLVEKGIRFEHWIKVGSSIDYPSFMDKLEYSTLLKFVNVFLTKQINQEQQKKSLTYHLMEYLCKLLMNRCVNLTNLEFRSFVIQEIFIIPFYHFPGANCRLVNITTMTLDCLLSYCDEFFYALSGICKQIKILNLSHLKENKALTYFIESLAYLEELLIEYSDVQFPTNSSSEKLKNRASFLKCLAIYDSSVSTDFLAQCINLKKLIVSGNNFFQNSTNVGLNRLRLDNLEKISIKEVSNEHMTKIRKLLVHTLKSVSLKIYSGHSSELTKVIVQNYTNLVYFNGIFDDSLTFLLPTFVQNCPFLEIFKIYTDDDLSNIDISDELIRLAIL
ncbi:10362_t:CDS:2 [Funneliformis mosseae]|uniref:10362_t:CDS:1 n=1 Tax=Funneliformis mosseae TaxID=27381 RepID=A0A9N9F992_FUNMO|nr:10362_t:CDS:2 [Funneliformis mosseae]